MILVAAPSQQQLQAVNGSCLSCLRCRSGWNKWPFAHATSATQMPSSKALRAELLQLRGIVQQHPGIKMCNGLNVERGAAPANSPQKRLLKVKRGSPCF